MEKFSFSNKETDEQKIKRLLGFRDFPSRTQEEKTVLLGSGECVAALEAINTTTNPRKKREIKKGVVLETLEKGLIRKEVLKSHPFVYIGSGTDIEYPLALGGRVIFMVDPIFEDPEAQKSVIEQVEKLIADKPEVTGQTLKFKFNFGEGKENVTVDLIAKPYIENDQENSFKIPQNTGIILLFASQGPQGSVNASETMKEKLADGGAIISEHRLIPKEGKVIEMGI